MPREIFRLEWPAESLFEAADTQAAVPWPHAGFFPDGILDVIDLAVAVVFHLDRLRPHRESDSEVGTARTAGGGVHAAIDAQPRFDELS